LQPSLENRTPQRDSRRAGRNADRAAGGSVGGFAQPRPEPREQPRADAGHEQQLVDVVEAAMEPPVLDDARGEHRPDARERVQVRNAGAVQVQRVGPGGSTC
jgi:hypothetical protein